MPFLIANETLEKVGSYGLLPNMILYLMSDYHLGLPKGTNTIFFWSAASNFMPLLGACLSDSYLGRFLTIGFGSIASLLIERLTNQGSLGRIDALLGCPLHIPSSKYFFGAGWKSLIRKQKQLNAFCTQVAGRFQFTSQATKVVTICSC